MGLFSKNSGPKKSCANCVWFNYDPSSGLGLCGYHFSLRLSLEKAKNKICSDWAPRS